MFSNNAKNIKISADKIIGPIIIPVLNIPLTPDKTPKNIPTIKSKYTYSDGAFLNKIFLIFSLNSLSTITVDVNK